MDTAKENSNIKEANELLKLATVLDPNLTSELEIQWYMAIKQIGGVQEALKAANSCKPFISKVLLVMKSVHDIVIVAKIRNQVFQQILQLNYHLILIYQVFVKVLKPPNQIHQPIRTNIKQLKIKMLKHPRRDRKHQLRLLRNLDIHTRPFLTMVQVAAIELCPTTLQLI